MIARFRSWLLGLVLRSVEVEFGYFSGTFRLTINGEPPPRGVAIRMTYDGFWKEKDYQ